MNHCDRKGFACEQKPFFLKWKRAGWWLLHLGKCALELSSPLYNRLRYKYYHIQSVIFTTPFIWKVETSGIHWTTIQEEFIVSLYQLEMMAISWKRPWSAVCQKWGHCPQFQQSGQPGTSTKDECNFFTLHFARIEGSALNSGNLASWAPPPAKNCHLGV